MELSLRARLSPKDYRLMASQEPAARPQGSIEPLPLRKDRFLIFWKGVRTKPKNRREYISSNYVFRR